MDTELIQCLHNLSTRANRIILSKIDINHIVQIDNEFEIDQFLDVNCYGLQDDLKNTNEKTINIIVKNLVSAIGSNCGNSIDLTKYSKEDDFNYSCTPDPNERSVYKRYKINSFSPKDISIFKEIWLFRFVDRLKTILFNIKYILNLTQQAELGLNKKIKSKRMTIKGKKIYEIIKRVNLEIEFLRDDITATDFINVLLGKSDKEIHLNISNRDFHYLLTKIGEYFFNFSFTAVAKTNKIYSKNGNLITPNNLNNSKCDFPNLKDEIDVNFNLGR